MARKSRAQSRKEIIDRFWEKISRERKSGCWLWTGALNSQGYGHFYANGRGRGAHCVAYELYVGLIPIGLELDHKCRVTACVNPDHLEPVTHAENCGRGLAGIASGLYQQSKTHCPSGHPYNGSNIYFRKNGHRDCKICGQLRSMYYQRKRRDNLNKDDRKKIRIYARGWMRQKRAKAKATTVAC